MYRQLGELLGYIVWERVILELGAIAVQTKKKTKPLQVVART
jgi:hypothetical protein